MSRSGGPYNRGNAVGAPRLDEFDTQHLAGVGGDGLGGTLRHSHADDAIVVARASGAVGLAGFKFAPFVELMESV